MNRIRHHGSGVLILEQQIAALPESEEAAISVFVLVHGAWAGGWCWELAADGLRRAGHAVHAPDLAGLGEDRTGHDRVTLDLWVDDLTRLIGEQHEPVLLAGHSRGGIVISQTAERIPERVKALVYICAFLLPSGRTLNDAIADTPRLPGFEAGLTPTADGLSLSITSEAARLAFLNTTPEPYASRAAARMRPEPLAPLGTALALTEARFGGIPRHYVECLQDNAIPISQQRAMQAALPCASVVTLDCDHSPYYSKPDELVTALDRIAKAAG